MNLISLLAEESAPQPKGDNTTTIVMWIILAVVIIAFFIWTTISNKKRQKQEQERQAQIIAKLNKIYYRVERNNLLVEKNVFGRWNLRSKLLRLKETAPPKKKKKAINKLLFEI